MASNSDDNPFARNSAWPRMPQTPFRVGPIPVADSGPATDSSTPGTAVDLPQTITPLFVRPIASGADPELSLIRRPEPPQAILAPPPAVGPVLKPPEPVIDAPVNGVPDIDLPLNTAEPPFKPVFAERAERIAAKRSGQANFGKRVPAIVATLVGLGGLIGLAVMLTRQAPPPAATPRPVSSDAPVLVEAPPTPAATPSINLVPARIEAAPRPASMAAPGLERIRPILVPPSRPVRTVSPPITRPPVGQPPTPSAAAIQDMFDTTVLTLPPATAQSAPVGAPPPKPLVEDPGAPITTRAPFS